MAEQFLGSSGTSLVRCGMGRVARGAHSATLAVSILWLYLSRESQSVWSMRTREGSWRQRSVENVYQQSWLWEQRHSYDRWNATDWRYLWTEGVSLCLHQNAREYSGSSSRGRTIRIYSRVPSKGDFGKEKRDYRIQTVGNAPGVMQRRSRQSCCEKSCMSRCCGTCNTRIQQAQQRERELGEELASLERQLSEQVSMDKSNAAMAGGNSLD